MKNLLTLLLALVLSFTLVLSLASCDRIDEFADILNKDNTDSSDDTQVNDDESKEPNPDQTDKDDGKL